MKKTRKAYIIYKKNNYNNDFMYIKEYYNKKEIEKEYNLKYNVIYNYITTSIDKVNHLLQDKYVIIKEDIEA